MARRYELTAKQFALLEDLLPARGKRGGRWNDHHTTLNGIFWWLYSGAQWREVPERYDKWQSVYETASTSGVPTARSTASWSGCTCV